MYKLKYLKYKKKYLDLKNVMGIEDTNKKNIYITTYNILSSEFVHYLFEQETKILQEYFENVNSRKYVEK